MKIRDFLAIVEIRTKVISLCVFLFSTLYALRMTGQFSLLRFIFMFIAVMAVDMGTTAFNSYFDYLHGTDNRLYNREPDKLLVHQELSPGTALISAILLYTAAFAAGLIIALLSGFSVALAGAVCMIVGFLYTGGPLPISRTPLGEFFAGAFLGTALFVINYRVQAGFFEVHALMISVPPALFIALILLVNNTCDMKGDARSGRRTLPLVIGSKAARILMVILFIGSWAGTVMQGLTGKLPASVLLIGLPPFLFSDVILFRMFRIGFSHETKSRWMKTISFLFLLFSLPLILSLFPSLWRVKGV